MTSLTPPSQKHATLYRGVQLLCVAVCVVSAFVGCAMTEPSGAGLDAWSTGIGHGPVGSSHASDPSTAARELAVARRMVRVGEFSLVIPRLQQIISKYPGDPAAIEARYYLGQSYYSVGAYNDALRYLNEYIELAPGGEHVASGREYVARLTDQEIEIAPTELEEKAATLQDAIDQEPENMAAHLELANLYWEHGEYQSAGNVYGELLRRWPRIAQDPVVQRRIERDAAGKITVLTPKEVERRHREEEPLLIYNVSSFRSGRFEGWPATSHNRYYNVTGQAVNQSQNLLRDVRVVVTIYGFGHMVYDTKTVNLGTLRPQEVRAFSVQFSQFDNIHNITRHECVGTFRR